MPHSGLQSAGGRALPRTFSGVGRGDPLGGWTVPFLFPAGDRLSPHFLTGESLPLLGDSAVSFPNTKLMPLWFVRVDP